MKPHGTKILISMTKLQVKVNLKGFLGFLDNMLNNPSDKYVQKLTEVWWNKNNATLVKKAEKFLNQIAEKHLSTELETALKGVGQ